MFDLYAWKLKNLAFNFFLKFYKKDFSFFVKIKKKHIKSICLLLKTHTQLQFKFLQDICVLDVLDNKNYFIVYYALSSFRNSSRVFLMLRLNKKDYVTSISNIFSNTNWIEREVWDMLKFFILNYLIR